MKKLEKLQINSEKRIKDEELISLKGGWIDGGYGGCDYYCVVREYFQGQIILEGGCCLESAEACVLELGNMYHLDTTCWHI